MKIVCATIACAAALAASGCNPAAAPDATTTPAASFTINDLTDADNTIQGCSTMLSRAPGAPGAGLIFLEDGVDTGAKGFIRINGNLIHVDLVSATGSEAGAVRAFADAAHTVQIVENTVTGESHIESDSVEESGTLAVTFGGATQTIAVEGGTAC